MARKKIEFARQLRRKATDAERLLWKHLRLRNIDGYRFRRQHVVGEFIADFACLEAMLVVELDGGQHADSAKYDTDRSRFLEANGFRVLRFWNNDAVENIEGVLHKISEALRAANIDQQSL
jgi:very-short-patch-repair endonuclease